jgi:hypothetical protein
MPWTGSQKQKTKTKTKTKTKQKPVKSRGVTDPKPAVSVAMLRFVLQDISVRGAPPAWSPSSGRFPAGERGFRRDHIPLFTTV